VDYSPYDKKCLGEKASAADLWECQKASHKSHRPLLDGLYVSQLKRWQRAFDKSQVWLYVVAASALAFQAWRIASMVVCTW